MNTETDPRSAGATSSTLAVRDLEASRAKLGERLGELRLPSRWARTLAGAVLGVLAATLLWTRLVGLDASLWHDEAYTILKFVNSGPTGILGADYDSNNHALFSLLTWATAQVLAPSEVVYRLWSVLPAIAGVAALTWWCARRLGVVTAVVFAFLAVISPIMLGLSTQARGYGLAFLSMSLMIIAADWAAKTGDRRALVALAVAGAVGTWAYPVVLLGFIGIAIALLARAKLRRPILLTAAALAAVTALFYAPAAGGLLDRVGGTTRGSPALETLSWAELPAQPTLLVAPSVDLLITGDTPLYCGQTCQQGQPLFAYGAVPVLLAVLAGIALWRRGNRSLALILTLPIVTTLLALAALGAYVTDRYFSFLTVPFFVLVAVGVGSAVVPLRRRAVLAGVAVAAGLALMLFGLVRTVNLAHRWAETPLEDIEQVAQIVNGSGLARVVTNSDRPEGLQYYLGRTRFAVLPDRPLRSELCTTGQPLVYIEHRITAGEPPGPESACLRRRGAVRILVPQRIRGNFTVWLVGGPGASTGRPRPLKRN